MGFLLRCPGCGERNVYEFGFGGEYHLRPAKDASTDEWIGYMYERENQAGVEKEWWYHRHGCRRWFLAFRDTRNNTVLRTLWPGEE